jgi:hypothetical protein
MLINYVLVPSHNIQKQQHGLHKHEMYWETNDPMGIIIAYNIWIR